MYGPPAHPNAVALAMGPLDEPLAWTVCLLLGGVFSLLALRRTFTPELRAFLFCLGQTILLTAPLAGHLQDALFGAFPTVDKSGSIAFYLDGIHRRLLFHPIDSLSDPAAQLIGIHASHLWVSEFFDLFLDTAGAFNIQALLYPTLGWWCCALFARQFETDWPTAIALGFGYGLGLHVFSDLNWYTIEKAAVFTLPLYGFCVAHVLRAQHHWRWWAALAWCLAALVNLYFALVAAIATAILLALMRHRGLAQSALATGLLALPLIAYQLALLSRGPQPANAEAYLQLRAAKDVLSLGDLTWNRLEIWRSVDPILIVAASIGLFRGRSNRTIRAAIVIGIALTYLSLGPYLAPGTNNPGWQTMRNIIPGLWRLSEPEVFFQGSVLALVAIAAAGLGKARRTWLYPLSALSWLLLVRTHPAYPGFSAFSPPRLAPDWSAPHDGEPVPETRDRLRTENLEKK